MYLAAFRSDVTYCAAYSDLRATKPRSAGPVTACGDIPRSIARPAALSAVFRKANIELNQELIDDLARLAAQFDLL